MPMMKRTISLIILLSMMLHAGSRLGVLSYVYQNRHEIAFNAGLIAEVPIALCDSDHDFNRGLRFQHHESDQQQPVSLAQAREILLFVHQVNLQPLPEFSVLRTVSVTVYPEAAYASPPIPVFHPPCEA
jgi:hypothetical protein